MIALISFFRFFVFVAASIRRLHDLGKSGWLLVLWPVPVVGVVFLGWFFFRPGAPASPRGLDD